MIHKFFRKYLVILVFIAALVKGNATVGLSQDWKALTQAADSIRSLKSEFIQKKDLRILSTPLISKGRLYYQAPDLLRWEYFSPLKSVMLKKGEAINTYQFFNGAWKADLSQAVELRGMIFAEINKWLKGRFNVTDSFTPSYSSGPPVHVIFTPRQELKSYLLRIELIFSERPGIIKSVEIIESDDARTMIEFINLEINSNIPAEVFEKP